MTESEIKFLIERAFECVSLSGGVSLRQAEVMDNYGEGCTAAEFAKLPLTEITSDWRLLPVHELEKYAYLSHLDSLGFRYYIPAFIVSVLDGAARYSNRWIPTLYCLYPKHDDLWDHCMMHYAALDDAQKSAIAEFLKWVSNCSKFDKDDRNSAEQALQNYWSRYLREK